MSAGPGVRARLWLAIGLSLALAFCYGLAAGGYALLAGLAVTGLGILQAKAAERGIGWASYPLILAEFALVTAVLLWFPLLPGLAPAPKALLFHSPAILLLFALIAINAVTVRPTVTWWAGASALLCWWTASSIAHHDPLTLTKEQLFTDDAVSLTDFLDVIMQPRYLSLDALWLQLAVLAGCTVILGLAAWRTRSLAREAAVRQAALANLSGHFAGPVADALLSQGFERPAQMDLAVLECDLVGFTARAAQLDPEAVARGLRAYHGLVEETVFAHGGAVLKYIGDGVIAVFGFTGAAEASAQALACAEALASGWAKTGVFDCAIAIGVDYGEATAGIVGEGQALTLIVTGPAVEGAARLQAERGEAGAVRASPAVLAAA